jgi:hypothetical protein
MAALQKYLAQHGHVVILQVCEDVSVFLTWKGDLYSHTSDRKTLFLLLEAASPFKRKLYAVSLNSQHEVLCTACYIVAAAVERCALHATQLLLAAVECYALHANAYSFFVVVI